MEPRQNKILIILALIADVALVANVIHHWDSRPQIHVAVECHSIGNKLACAIVNEEAL